jgi:molybdopterin molybdotransferase
MSNKIASQPSCADPFEEGMISQSEALERIEARIHPVLACERLPIRECLNRVNNEAVKSPRDVPPQPNSAMDGFAIAIASLLTGGIAELDEVGTAFAGVPFTEDCGPGQCVRIMTGALIPAGTDAVIMQEQVEAEEGMIRFEVRPGSGQNIRPRGNDIRRGTTILQQGSRLRAQDIGLAASVGLQSLPVYAPVRVGIFFTGDELVEPGEQLTSGKIYDSNRYTLHGLLESMGCEIIDLGLVGDTLQATREAMLQASKRADLVVTSGGVSVGDEDHVRIAIEQLGELRLWRLGIKPGKPLAYGQINDTAFIGLPGNPVSVFATFCLFVCPVIQIMQGRSWRKPIALPVRADFDWPKPDSRREFLRARLARAEDGETVVQIFPNQDSGVLTSTVWADGFVEIPENVTVRSGDYVNYLPFTQFF